MICRLPPHRTSLRIAFANFIRLSFTWACIAFANFIRLNFAWACIPSRRQRASSTFTGSRQRTVTSTWHRGTLNGTLMSIMLRWLWLRLHLTLLPWHMRLYRLLGNNARIRANNWYAFRGRRREDLRVAI